MPTIRRLVSLAVASLMLLTSHSRVSNALTSPFSIRWTAPGDDGHEGRATAYDLRYSLLPITAANFPQAMRVLGLPTPAAAGTLETFVVSGLTDGVLYYMAIRTADETGNWSPLSNVCLRNGLVTGVEGSTLAFSSPFPNPARSSVQWTYSLPLAAHVQVEVFDASGRHVYTVADAAHEAGSGGLAWDLRDDRGHGVGAGVYFVKARLGSSEWTKRLLVVR